MNKKRKTKGIYIFSRLDDTTSEQYYKEHIVETWDNGYNRLILYGIPHYDWFEFYKSFKKSIRIDYYTYFITIRNEYLSDAIRTYEVYNYKKSGKRIEKRELSISESFYNFLNMEIEELHPTKYEILKDSPLILSIVDELVINYLNIAKNENKHIIRIGFNAMSHTYQEKEHMKFVLKTDPYLDSIKSDFDNLIKYINKTYDAYRKDHLK